MLGAALAAMSSPLPYRSIRLHGNELTDVGMEAIARGMCGGFLAHDAVVVVKDNKIGRPLPAVLPDTMRQVWMYDNECGDAGMVAMAEVLGRSPSFKDFQFQDNRIGALGFEAVAKALPCWTRLDYLLVQRNPGPADAFALALIHELPKVTESMRVLVATDIRLSDTVKQQLAAAFEATGNKKFKCLSPGEQEELAAPEPEPAAAAAVGGAAAAAGGGEGTVVTTEPELRAAVAGAGGDAEMVVVQAGARIELTDKLRMASGDRVLRLVGEAGGPVPEIVGVEEQDVLVISCEGIAVHLEGLMIQGGGGEDDAAIYQYCGGGASLVAVRCQRRRGLAGRRPLPAGRESGMVLRGRHDG